MNAAEARLMAESKMREVEDPDTPLKLDDNQIEERPWCWIFWFNTVDYFETHDPLDTVLSGPIVVNKDGSEVWIAESSRPPEQLLDEYATRHGYESDEQSSSK